VEGDDLIVAGPAKLKAARFNPKKDHRLAMTAMVAGLLCDGETLVKDGGCAAISYPSFYEDLKNAH
jgi:3-phosphoshikimate 1-carboxyvinyltransferase